MMKTNKSCSRNSTFSRREFLVSSGAGLTAFAIASGLGPGFVMAQGNQNPALPDRSPNRKLLLKGGLILSMDDAVGDFEQGDVLIEGSTITAVGPNINAGDAQVIDASRMIIMPGFVDTHRHSWQGQLRNILPNGKLQERSRHRSPRISTVPAHYYPWPMPWDRTTPISTAPVSRMQNSN